MLTRVIVTHRVAGFHNWPEAPPGVEYLRARHRHLFHVRVEYDVSHGQREVEFHTALTWLTSALSSYPGGAHGVEFGARSCEHIASELLARLDVAAVEVWEDGEHGARVER